MLIEALFLAPFVGINPSNDSHLHRVNIEGIPDADLDMPVAVMRAVCGAKVAAVRTDTGYIEWYSLRTRGTRYQRCPQCRLWRATEDQ